MTHTRCTICRGIWPSRELQDRHRAYFWSHYNVREMEKICPACSKTYPMERLVEARRARFNAELWLAMKRLWERGWRHSVAP